MFIKKKINTCLWPKEKSGNNGYKKNNQFNQKDCQARGDWNKMNIVSDEVLKKKIRYTLQKIC